MKARRLFSYPLSLAIVVAALVSLTGGWIAWWNYRAGLANARELAGSLFDQVAHRTAARTEAFLSKAPPAARALANLAALDDETVDSDALARRFLAVLRANPGFTWVSFSDASGAFTGAYRTPTGLRVNQSRILDGKTVLDEHDVAADGSWKPYRHDPDTGYDPRTRPFYKLAAAARAGAWTQPYVFAGQDVPGITYAEPLLAGGQLRGVFTIDFDLARLSRLVRSLHPGAHGAVAIVADDGVVLAHPTAPIVTGAGKDAALVHVQELADPAARAAVAAGPGATGFAFDGTRYLARSIAVPGVPWRVVAFAPESDFTAGLRGRVWSSLLMSLLAVIIAIALASLLARRVSRPLSKLAAEMAEVGEFRIPERPHPRSLFKEIAMMTAALEKMEGGLRSFARYVPRDLVRAVLASGRDATLAGELRELTVYFSDLAGFTTLAETMAPDALVKFLGTYFDETSQIIAREQGTVDKYLGDGIMAFWGAPAALPEHAARACAAALGCHRAVQALAARGTKLAARIGIATGEVLVGNIGSTERMNYTVMGDVANLASRLESLNKQYGTELMISEATFAQAKGAIVARPLDVVAVKGKQRGVRVYELLALASDGDAAAEAIAIAEASTEALDAYLARDFVGAAAAWERVLARRPGDVAAMLMRDRARGYAENPPPEEWTGVKVATAK